MRVMWHSEFSVKESTWSGVSIYYTGGYWDASTGEGDWQEPHQVQQKQAEICIWANPGPQYSLGPTLQSSTAKRDPEMGCNVNETQQCALVAKVANSVLPSISRIATSRDSKVNSPFHLDTPGVLCTGLVFPLQHISMWKPIYNIQFHHKGFCVETKYIYIMKPHQEKKRFRKLVGVPN